MCQGPEVVHLIGMRGADQIAFIAARARDEDGTSVCGCCAFAVQPQGFVAVFYLRDGVVVDIQDADARGIQRFQGSKRAQLAVGLCPAHRVIAL